jgi:cytochrome c biogenesis protein CcmG/thiol:disulfide interchange protein DsbE
MLRFILPLGLFIGLVVFLAMGLKLDPRLVPSPFLDKPAPALDLPRLKGEGGNITGKDLLGKITLVNVWASWCVACRQEHQVLLRLAKEGDFKLLGFNYKDRREDALNWLNTLGDPYGDIAFDNDGRAAINWGVYGVPESFLIDKQGIVRYKHVGPLSWEDVEKTLRPLARELKK